ncbi:GNAT family N-acetyltransferase [Pseudomonas fontis]|uniref:GNAT family N-acetyltransferase n=1 Tax=Pseudomonas fontis TaxID=2942633 RepID=A0ABT5NQI2_9PSED|nr:GNAT family N-acetyltransferase [Pseudomonas fontis]MDD0974624.1 GNAT family N-acetyltransferase [Pseudomonas fontis]MDD0990433.1 GNAT family N-acetyltransferase [Pseudomonas fontis]
MPSITLFHTPPPETIKAQVQQMVIDYLTDVSQVAIAPSNPLYQLYQYGVGFEVHLYLQAMDGTRNLPVELIVALDEHDPETVLGFVLYQPVIDDAQACAVVYMAVRAAHRRQGIARSMLQQLTARYPHVELACTVNKVAYFEAMGLQVLAARGPQVLMNTRDYRTDGLLPVLDVAPIYSSLEVRQIHAYLLAQHGKKVMTEAEKKRDRHLDQLTYQARLFVDERLGG